VHPRRSYLAMKIYTDLAVKRRRKQSNQESDTTSHRRGRDRRQVVEGTNGG
jgi:hypothetical protein